MLQAIAMPMILPLAVLLLLALAGALYERRAGKDAYERFRPPGRRVDVGGRRLYALVQGERRPGQPLVVCEAGHGDWSKCWMGVQAEVARFARVLAYDRAGSGWSDPGPLPRTPERMVADLHALLERCGEPGPFLLVGHSMGGPLSRLYFQRYPGEVCGMVWVDSAHERMIQFFPFYKKALASLLASILAGRALSRLGIARLVGKKLALAAYPSVSGPAAQAELQAQVCAPRFFDWLYAETAALGTPGWWPDPLPALGSLPVISIEAQYTREPPPHYPRKQWQQFLKGWYEIANEVTSLSKQVRRIPAPTGHAVMHEAPDLIVQAIREMVDGDLATRGAEPRGNGKTVI